MDAEQAVGARAQRQHGLITRAQARELGISDDVIDWRVKTGAWERVQRGVLRLPGSGFSLCPPSSPGRPGTKGRKGAGALAEILVQQQGCERHVDSAAQRRLERLLTEAA